ncbi:MAG: hypothetical protein AABN95_08890 [Acidobacteriota bacterium]
MLELVTGPRYRKLLVFAAVILELRLKTSVFVLLDSKRYPVNAYTYQDENPNTLAESLGLGKKRVLDR